MTVVFFFFGLGFYSFFFQRFVLFKPSISPDEQEKKKKKKRKESTQSI